MGAKQSRRVVDVSSQDVSSQEVVDVSSQAVVDVSSVDVSSQEVQDVSGQEVAEPRGSKYLVAGCCSSVSRVVIDNVPQNPDKSSVQVPVATPEKV